MVLGALEEFCLPPSSAGGVPVSGSFVTVNSTEVLSACTFADRWLSACTFISMPSKPCSAEMVNSDSGFWGSR